jgi:hypothetical protein
MFALREQHFRAQSFSFALLIFYQVLIHPPPQQQQQPQPVPHIPPPPPLPAPPQQQQPQVKTVAYISDRFAFISDNF